MLASRSNQIAGTTILNTPLRIKRRKTRRGSPVGFRPLPKKFHHTQFTRNVGLVPPTFLAMLFKTVYMLEPQ